MKNIRYELRNLYFLNVIKKYNFNEVCYFDFSYAYYTYDTNFAYILRVVYKNTIYHSCRIELE